MRILIDGDGCPGRRLIEKIAREYNIPLFLYCDINHFINLEYGEVKYLDSGFQSVDIFLANVAKKNDIVVTGDFGLASMILAKNAVPVSPKGLIYTQDNIDRLLMERHISAKIRKGGGKTTNPKKRTKEDDEKLISTLKYVIEKSES